MPALLGPRAARGSPAPNGKAARYAVVKIVGRGSFGTAYLVRRKADSFLYVMKKLQLDQLGKKERDEAQNECMVLSKLRNHPNIVRVVEHFVDDGKLCIVMEYADGGDLAKRIEAQAASKTNFREDQVLDWFVQICLALKHAHDRKILHRDLKPQNIFLTAKNFVRLGDFGISKVLSNTLSVASTCVGTPLYLAPELCEGKEYDNKSDVWSLGAILYELCALQPPFTANTMPALVMRICGDKPPPLHESFSRPLRELAMVLLDKDPSKRPRVHEILHEDFIHARITESQLLSPEELIAEFSHTIIHAGGGPLAAGADDGGAAAGGSKPPSRTGRDTGRPASGKGGAAPSAAATAARTKGGRPPPAPGGAPSVTKKTSGGGTTGGAKKTAGGARGKSPAPLEREEEDPTARAMRLQSAEDRREAMRAQVRHLPTSPHPPIDLLKPSLTC